MNSKKRGKLFAVLMVCFIAYGFGSSVSLLTSDTISLEVPSVLAADQQQISTIGDPNFEPVWLKQQLIKNITNNTNTTIHNNTNTNNSTLKRINNSN
ncbi:MAG: hypothetical protein Q8N97_03955 [Methanobacteriaceae archaeon]|nr:hypothetical protein [Methanobacteriaceae archaeon]MDP3033494.1 hypothetical protein [Methanobacteriaceae archaeon]MDP3484357.1 hypothetical protein [Methanobacteriaceae archaeon]